MFKNTRRQNMFLFWKRKFVMRKFKNFVGFLVIFLMFKVSDVFSMGSDVHSSDVEFSEKTYEDVQCVRKIIFSFYKDNFDWCVVDGSVDYVFKLLLLKDSNFFYLDIRNAYEKYYNALKNNYRKRGDFNLLLEYFEFFNPENFEYFEFSGARVTLKFEENELYKNNIYLFRDIYYEFVKNIEILNKNSNINLSEKELKVCYLFLEINQFFRVFFVDRSRRKKLMKQAEKERFLLNCNGSFYEQFYYLDENDMKFKNIDTDKDDSASFENISQYYDLNVISIGCVEFLEFLNNFLPKERLILDRHFKNKNIEDLNLGEYALELFIKYCEPILDEACGQLHGFGVFGDRNFEILKIVFDIIKRDMVVLKKFDERNILCDIKLKLVKNRFFNYVIESVNLFYFSNPIFLVQFFGENDYKCNRLFCLYFSKIMFFINGLNTFSRDFYMHYENHILK